VTDAMILHRLLESLFAIPREHRHDVELPPRRAVSAWPASRPHPAGDRVAEDPARVVGVDNGVDYRRRALEQVRFITRR